MGENRDTTVNLFPLFWVELLVGLARDPRMNYAADYLELKAFLKELGTVLSLAQGNW